MIIRNDFFAGGGISRAAGVWFLVILLNQTFLLAALASPPRSINRRSHLELPTAPPNLGDFRLQTNNIRSAGGRHSAPQASELAPGSLIARLPRPSLPPPPLPEGYEGDDDYARLPVRPEPVDAAPLLETPALPPPLLPQPPLPPSTDSTHFSFAIKALNASEQVASNKVLESTPLDGGRVEKLLARLQPLKMPLPVAVNIPPKPIPPPPVGKQILSTFPPAPTALAPPARPAVSPLRVVRFGPQGKIHASSKQLSVTFSQPMVPLSTVSEVATRQHGAVILTPQPPGTWRWLDTRTLLFEPDVRFPAATKYTANVTAGTKSAQGGKLEAGVLWTFQTERPKLLDFNPSESAFNLHPNMIALFNQKIREGIALSKIRVLVTAPGLPPDSRFPIRPLTADEIKNDSYIGDILKGAAEDSVHGYFAFKSDRPFPRNASVQVVFDKGLASTVGNLTSEVVKTMRFRTYAPLKLSVDAATISPNDFITLESNNAVSLSSFNSSLIQVHPAIPNAKILAGRGRITISGTKKAGTTYTVTVSPELKDLYGQKLGARKTFTAKVIGFKPGIYTGDFNGGHDVFLIPGQTELPVFSINYPTLKVSAYKVAPNDSSTFEELSKKRKPDWSSKISITHSPDQVAETTIKLGQLLPAGFGTVVLSIEPMPQKVPPGEERERLEVRVRATRLAARAVWDQFQSRVVVTSLDTGKAVSGADVILGKQKALTDKNGVAAVGLPTDDVPNLIVRAGHDTAVIPWSDKKKTGNLYDEVWYVFTDRGAYRPGEEVFVKGCCRKIGPRPLADLEVSGLNEITISVESDGRALHSAKVKPDAFGAFSHSFKLPADAPTGDIGILTQGIQRTTIKIEEFRRPEFTVALVDQHPEQPHFMGTPVTLAVSANYFAGGALGGAAVDWSVRGLQSSFTPAGWDQYSFGPTGIRGAVALPQKAIGCTDPLGNGVLSVDLTEEATPQSIQFSVQADVKDINRQTFAATTMVTVHPARRFVGIKFDRSFIKSGESILLNSICTDVDGKICPARVKLETFKNTWNEKTQNLDTTMIQEQMLEPSESAASATLKFDDPGSYVVRATVTDPDGRKNAGEGSLDVYPTGDQVYSFGLPSDSLSKPTELTLDKASYKDGETARIAVKSPYKRAEGLVLLSRRGIFSTQAISIKNGVGIVEIPIQEAFVPSIAVDVYLVEQKDKLDNRDGKWWTDRSSATISISVPPLARELKVSVTPEVAELEPGAKNSVKVVVQDSKEKPISGSQVTIAVVDESVLALTGYAMPNPISAFYQAVNGSLNNTDSVTELSAFDIKSMKTSAITDLTTGDYKGIKDGVSSSLPPPSLPPPPLPDSAIDTGKCTRFVPSPMPVPKPSPSPRRKQKSAKGDFFEEPGEIQIIDERPVIQDFREGGQPQMPSTAVAVRSNFNPVALFATAAITGSDGSVNVPFTMPDNLTRYRVMVFALAGQKQFGKGESTITARLPLSLRQSPPRFLNAGDQCEISFVLQNQTNAPQVVSLAMRGTASDVRNGSGKEIKLGAAERGEVRFPVKVDTAGNALFQSIAVSGTYADAQEFSFPVYTPATTETFATYGSIDKDEEVLTQPLKPPADVYTQFGGMDLTTSSTALQELTDAVLYLKRYGFECSEQLSSRIIVLSALNDVLAAFQLAGVTKVDLSQAVSRAVKELTARQNVNTGAFGFWRAGDKDYPYVNVYASHALSIAAQKGLLKDPAVLERCKSVLRNTDKAELKDYDETTRAITQSYSVYVLSLLGEHDDKSIKRILSSKSIDSQSPEVLSWLLQSMKHDKKYTADAAKIQQTLNNKITETASSAECKWSAGDYSYLTFQSGVRTSALVLSALIDSDPANEVIPKMVKGLLRARTHGYWGNTQENAVACLALDRYFRTYEKATPDFIARMWLGDTYLGEEKFKGRSTATHNLSVPTASLYKHWEKEEPLLLSKSGKGRLYYRIGLTYAPRSVQLQPLNAGFEVKRTYEGVDNPADVRKDENGIWHIKAGALVRVRLAMSNNGTRYHVALVDPLPAGLEPLNPELSGTRTVEDSTKPEERVMWYQQYWFDHNNLRDNRAEVFSALLGEGAHPYTYLTRATTYGAFVAPPTRAEEMYQPETFGRGGTDMVVVE